MYKIYKISEGEAIDYAASELRKYLSMMQPDGGSYSIHYNKEAKDGYRLGLMSDFGLDTSDVSDTELDDIIYIDTVRRCGIIAGSNPRSVLIAVYEYLRHNGCEWLMPGIDGELIPTKEPEDVKYRFKPTLRYRGWVLEGCLSQRLLLEAIEYMPKLGLNSFMIQFKYPRRCYERFYNHDFNPERIKENIDESTMLKWKRMAETELQKRGIHFHDLGHGFTYEPLGIPGGAGWDTEYDRKLDRKTRNMIAVVNGERKIFHIPINTNFCMSQKNARMMVASYVVDYLSKHSNVDYLHVWLADANNNHCECKNCREKLPSDWYVTLLNEIDEALNLANIKTRIVFIAYMDTAWAPLKEKIKNPKRFLLMIAPITRSYTATLPNGVATKLTPFNLNKLSLPRDLGVFLAHLKSWDKSFSGNKISFEYHFWRPMYLDPSAIRLSKVINEDVREYLRQDVDGILECGTQRCFTPNGLGFYTYARSAFDSRLSADEIKEKYFSLLYGDAKDEVEEYLISLERAFGMEYLAKERSSDRSVSVYYNPERAKSLEEVKAITERASRMIEKNLTTDSRPLTAAMKILMIFNEIMRYYAHAMREKANGHDREAKQIYDTMKTEIGKREIEIEEYYDHGQLMDALRIIFDNTFSNLPENDYM